MKEPAVPYWAFGQAEESGSSSSLTPREDFILRMVTDAGQVEVNALAAELDVSEMTVRRDLAKLDEVGLVRRVHGGATLRRSGFSRRADIMSDEKKRIARAVSRLVKRDDIVGIDSGTTCRAVAAELALHERLFAVTNSIPSAMEFQRSHNPLRLLGGMLTPDGALSMVESFNSLDVLHIDTLVLGCGGVSTRSGVSYFDPAETEVRKWLLGISDRVILAADHSKLGKHKPVSLGSLDLVDVLITTGSPTPALGRALLAAGVEVIVIEDEP